MLLGRILADLFDHSGKIVAAVLVLGGLFVWFTMPATHPVSTLLARCQEQQLQVRVIQLEPGSHEEERFLAMVPGGNRERLPDGHWAFCRANLQMRTQGDFSMKSDDWFREDVYRPPEEESSADRERRITIRRTARTLRLLLLGVVTLTAILMLYWLVQVFICDFRDAVSPGMGRRAPWLCR